MSCVRSQSRVLIIVENLTRAARPARVAGGDDAARRRLHGLGHLPEGGTLHAAYEVLDGIHVFRHPLPFEADGALGYAIEYSWALFWEFVLSLARLFQGRLRRHPGLQSAGSRSSSSAASGSTLFGKPFVFDHHDINPELYEAKFGRRGVFHRLLLWLERMTFRTADVSIATNETFKEIAIERGGMDPRARVHRALDPGPVALPARRRPSHACKQRPQAPRRLCRHHGRAGRRRPADRRDGRPRQPAEAATTCNALIVGSGTELERLKAHGRGRGLDDYVTFTGFLSGEPLLRALSTFDIGVIPDPKNSYNDKISMNKVFEYMTLGIPFVQFDLDEGRKIAGDAALYAADNRPSIWRSRS